VNKEMLDVPWHRLYVSSGMQANLSFLWSRTEPRPLGGLVAFPINRHELDRAGEIKGPSTFPMDFTVSLQNCILICPMMGCVTVS